MSGEELTQFPHTLPTDRYQFKQDDIVMLLDTQNVNQMEVPTKANIVRFVGVQEANRS